MFMRLIPRKIKNKKRGFSIEIAKQRVKGVGPSLTYIEGIRSVGIYCERLVKGPFDLNITLGCTDHWEQPFDFETITNDDWKRIGENIEDAYKSKRIKVKMDWMSPSEFKAMMSSVPKIK